MAGKQAELVEAIAAGVQAKMAGEIAALAETMAKVLVANSTIMARIDILDSVNAGGVAPKRAVRTGAAKKTAAPKGKGEDAAGKVTNGLLFTRYAMAKNLDGFRDTHGTEENLAEADNDPAVQKAPRDKDEEKYFLAVGSYLWKSVFGEDAKDEVRAQLKAWNEDRVRAAAEPQLEETPAEE